MMMYPRTVNGIKYCCESIRIDRRHTTTRSYGRCEPDSKDECKQCKFNKKLKNKPKIKKNPQRIFKIPLNLRRK